MLSGSRRCADRPPIDLDPAVGTLHGDEPAPTVDLVSIAGGQRGNAETLYAEDCKVLNDAVHQPSTQPPSTVMLIHEHVANPSKCGLVGDNTREGGLLRLGVHGVRTRSSD